MTATIQQLSQYVNTEVTLKGWVRGIRSSGKLHFITLRDGTGEVQCVVFKGDVTPEVFEYAAQLRQEASLQITGQVKAHPKHAGEFEIGVRDLQILALPSQDFPISPKEHGTDFLMDNRHLWLRSRRQHAIMRVRHEIVMAVRNYFDGHGFTLIDAPIFTPNACEGTSTLFETDYHGEPAYLTQSGQLYGEAAAAAFGKIYVFGPTFRAEKSKTRRHLAEFWMVEPEVAFMDLAGDQDLAEDFLCAIVQQVLAKRGPELSVLERDLSHLARVQKPFPRIRYKDAVDLLRSQGIEFNFGDDFGAPDETAISSNFDRPVIVTHYPMSLKAFYFKRDPSDPAIALNMDVLAPEGYGEIIGGGQREDDLKTLEQAIAEHQLPPAAFDWYLDLRRYGSFPHAGFGLGIERTVAWICGLEHVRETIPFPRMLNRLRP